MAERNYKTSYLVAQTPEQVFAAISNPRAWWGAGITGETDRVGASFVYRHMPYHVSTQTITEFVPGKTLVWKISKSNLSFAKDKSEWDGTEVIFEIAKAGDKTRLTVTHSGLVPKLECFENCSDGWNFYLNQSLKTLIETGKGEPDPKSKAAA